MGSNAVRILLVEDNPGDARLLRETLREAPGLACEWTDVQRLDDALQRLKSQNFDLVLLDLSLPDSQGTGTVKRLAAAAPHVPVVVLTGTDDEAVGTEAVRCGAQDYLVKGQADHRLLTRSIRYAIERHRAEAALRESRERLDLALSSSRMATFDWDIARDKRTWSAGVHGLLGTRPEAFTGSAEEFFRVMPQADRGIVQADLARALETGAYDTEYRAVWPDGSLHYIAARGKVHRDHDGRAVQLTGVCWDITPRKQAENALRTTLQRFYSVLSSMYAGVLLVTDEGRVEFVNQAFCDRFELPIAPAELVGLASAAMIEKIKTGYAQPDAAVARIAEILKAGQPVKGEELAMRGGRTCLRDFVPLFVEGKSYGRLWIHIDITERQRAEAALRQSERLERERAEELAALLEAVPTAVFIAHDPDCRHIAGNRRADEILRIAHGNELSLSGPAETRPHHFRVFQDGRELALHELPAQRAAQGAHVKDFELTLVFDDGVVRHVLGYGTPLLDPQGRPRGAVAVLVDITARKQAEEELQKLASVVRHSREFVNIATPDGMMVFINDAGAEMIGLAPGDVPRTHILQVIPDHLQDKVKNEVLRALENQGFWEGELTYRNFKTGRLIDVYATTSAIRDPVKGTLLYLANTSIDITDRKRTEDALKFLVQCGDPASGEDFFRSLARYLGQNLGMDFVCIDRLEDGLLAATTLAVYFDGKFEDNMSYTLKDTPCGDVVGKSICCFAQGVRQLFPKDAVLQEMRAESYLGTTLWSSDGRPIGLIAVIGRAPLADMALPAAILQLVAVRAAAELERRQAEAALRQSEERYRSLFSTLIEGFCIIEVLFDDANRPVDYCFLEVNPAFEAQTGLHNAQGKRMRDLVPDHEAHWFELYGQVALTGQSVRFINQAQALHRWYDVSAYRVGGAGSRKVAILFNDITQRQQAEETIRQANILLEQRVADRTHQLAALNADLHDRMDAYQRLEAEVARLVEDERVQLGMELHDNLCQQIAATAMLTSTLVKRLRDQNSPLADMAGRLVASLSQAGNDAHALARGLLPVQVEADGLMVSLAGLAQRTADMQGVPCAFECAAPVPVESNATATHLFRIAQEAVQNALKHGSARHIVLTLTNHEGLTLTIFDDGRGIPPETQRSPGSGLRIMAHRARVIGAELSVEPAPAGGTLVRCALRKGPAPP